MRDIVVPCVHLNGTSRESLLKQTIDARQAVYAAIKAVKEASPHQRDYYVIGEDAWTRADNAHRERLQQLQSVYDDLGRIGEGIAEQ